ncbi:MAG: hypothetical protein AAGA92_06035 [Planctomycetota bacterium]
MIVPSAEEKERAKRIIIEIIRQAGGTFQYKTNLYKAFYHAHLEYAKENPGYLSAWPIVRMPRGPGIDNFDALLGELLITGKVHLASLPCGEGRQGCMFELTSLANSSEAMSDEEVSAIRYGVSRVDGKSAAQASHESHEESRSWRETPNGQELDIYCDLLSDEELAERRDHMRRLTSGLLDGLSSR